MDAKHLFSGVVNEASQTVSIGASRDERNTTFVSYFLIERKHLCFIHPRGNWIYR